MDEMDSNGATVRPDISVPHGSSGALA